MRAATYACAVAALGCYTIACVAQAVGARRPARAAIHIGHLADLAGMELRCWQLERKWRAVQQAQADLIRDALEREEICSA